MTKRKGVGVVGVGVMGSSIAERIVAARVIRRSQLTLFDAHGVSHRVVQMTGGRVVRSIADLARLSSTVVLCVKPQDARRLAEELSPHLRRRHLLVSIMAGVSLKSLERWFERRPIVRCIPNTPLRLGQGVTVWTVNRFVSRRQASDVDAIFRAFGWSLRVRDERFIDRVTVVSGSGPAYIFYFLDLLSRAARAIGLPHRLADRLTLETVHGAASLAWASGLPPSALRQQVTSKAGTTAAAIAELDRANLRGTMQRALRAALKRARRIGRVYG